MAVTGRTGADAIFKALHHICTVIRKFSVKLNAVVAAAEAAGALTSIEALAATGFIAQANGICDVFQKLSGYSGF